MITITSHGHFSHLGRAVRGITLHRAGVPKAAQRNARSSGSVDK
jgi:hypothetical protein